MMEILNIICCVIFCFLQTVRLSPPGNCPAGVVPTHVKTVGCRHSSSVVNSRLTTVRVSTPTTTMASIHVSQVTTGLVSHSSSDSGFQSPGKSQSGSSSKPLPEPTEKFEVDISVTMYVKNANSDSTLVVKVGSTVLPTTEFDGFSSSTGTEKSVPVPENEPGNTVAADSFGSDSVDASDVNVVTSNIVSGHERGTESLPNHDIVGTPIDGLMFGNSMFVNMSRLNFFLVMSCTLGACFMFLLYVMIATFWWGDYQRRIATPVRENILLTMAERSRPGQLVNAIQRDYSGGLQNANYNPNVELLHNPLQRVGQIIREERSNEVRNVQEVDHEQFIENYNRSWNPLVHGSRNNQDDSFTDDDSLDGYENAEQIRRSRLMSGGSMVENRQSSVIHDNRTAGYFGRSHL